ncbi:S9 family peptidase [Flammeovirgaceae bacterium]
MKSFITTISLELLPYLIFGQTKKPIVTSDLMKIVNASQVEVSPDGSRAIMVVTSKAVKDESDYYYTRHLYLSNLSTVEEAKQLTYGDKSAGQPVWSPDGKKIAFVRVEKNKPQIWLMSLDGGEPYPITKSKNGASSPQWSPDGKSILYSSSIPYHEIDSKLPWNYERPGRKYNDEPNFKSMSSDQKKQTKASQDGSIDEVRAWLAKNASQGNPRVFINESFQAENNLYTDLSFTHLFIKDLSKDEEAQITDGFQNFLGAQWSPDGKNLIAHSRAYKVHPDRDMDTDLWSIDPTTKSAKLFLSYSGYSSSNPIYSPDGKQIAFNVKPENDIYTAQSQIAVVSANGSNPKVLTASLDRDSYNASWSKDNQSIYFTAGSEGDGILFKVSAKGGKISKVIERDDVSVSGFALNGDRLVYTMATIENPSEVYLMNLKDKSQRQLTKLNEWVNGKIISVPKEYWVTRPDGVKVQYWVMEPVGKKTGVKYPTILYMHGGPAGMYGPLSQWDEFQLEASWGYGIVFANPRGSSGYGDKFKKGNMKDWGHGPAGDILGSLDDAAKNNDWIDQDQLFLAGGSYAGYMVAWIVGHDHRFKAANAQRGVYDLVTFLGEGNQYRLVPSYFGGYPWDAKSKDLIYSESPLSYVDQIKTPLLIMHNDKDLRTGVIQSEMLYKSLKLLNKPVEYIRYPDEGHELSRSGNPLRMMDRNIRIIEFFERYVNHPETPAAVSH